jgi:hypothetical protein
MEGNANIHVRIDTFAGRKWGTQLWGPPKVYMNISIPRIAIVF